MFFITALLLIVDLNILFMYFNYISYNKVVKHF